MATKNSSEILVARICSPLTLSPGITVEGNVPDVQEYDASANIYIPDYTATNLVLKPSLDVADPDGVIPDGPVALANMKWKLLEDGTSTEITTSTPGFSVASDGKLTVKRNCQGQDPMTLRFEAEYQDPRTGKVHYVNESHLVTCEGISQRPVLTLDTSGIIPYDPIRDGEKTRKVKATFTVGGQAVPAANYELVWQKRDCDIDNTWATVDPDEDIDVGVSADGTELTIKLWLIGYRIDLRCYAKYNPYGSPASVQIDARTPVATFSAERIETKINGYVKGAKQIRPGLKNISCEAVLWDSKGVIPNPDAVCDVEWRVASGTANGSLTYGPVIARGAKVSVPTTFVAAKYGGKAKAFFGAKDPLARLSVTENGTEYLLTDGGTLLLGR